MCCISYGILSETLVIEILGQLLYEILGQLLYCVHVYLSIIYPIQGQCRTD